MDASYACPVLCCQCAGGWRNNVPEPQAGSVAEQVYANHGLVAHELRRRATRLRSDFEFAGKLPVNNNFQVLMTGADSRRLFCLCAYDFCGCDGLAHMALRVIGDMDQESGNSGRNCFLPTARGSSSCSGRKARMRCSAKESNAFNSSNRAFEVAPASSSLLSWESCASESCVLQRK